MTQDHLRKLSDPSIQYNWYHLIAGSINTDPVPYVNTDGAVYNNEYEISNSLEELEKTAGLLR